MQFPTRKMLPFFLIVVLFIGVVAFIFIQKNSKVVQKNDTVSIVVSFYPLEEIAQRVGGNLVTVSNITPPGIEPHDFEPTPRDIASLFDADLILLNGHGLEGWLGGAAPDLLTELQQGGVRVLRMSDHIEALTTTGHTHEDAHETTDNQATVYDPHFWLDPTLMIREVDLVLEALIAIDGAHKDVYTANAMAYKNELTALDQAYRTQLAGCVQKELVTSHNAFGYLAHRYDLENLFISGLSPDEEPLPQEMAHIIEEMKEHNVTHIFFETLVSPKLAETIALEIGAQTLVLNPIEGLTKEEREAGKTYISIMHDNLTNMLQALACTPQT